jgi:predicted kinase
MNEKLAVIIRGPSAVGKSTIAALLHKKLPNSACIDIDILKRMISEESNSDRTKIAHVVALSFTQQLIGGKYNIILEEIFRDEHYKKFRELLDGAGYRVTSVFLTAPLPTLIERDAGRTNKVKGGEVVTRLHSEITPRREDYVIDVMVLTNEEVVEKILGFVKQA